MRDGCKCCCCRMEKESKSENRPRITARIRGILERSDASDSAELWSKARPLEPVELKLGFDWKDICVVTGETE